MIIFIIIIAVDHFPLPNMKIHIKWHNKYDQPKIRHKNIFLSKQSFSTTINKISSLIPNPLIACCVWWLLPLIKVLGEDILRRSTTIDTTRWKARRIRLAYDI
jgi:hypothetical protein